MFIRKTFIFFVIASGMLAGCSVASDFVSSSESSQNAAELNNESRKDTHSTSPNDGALAHGPESAASIEIFLNRAHMRASEFEHYSLDRQNLFVECGVVEHGRNIVKYQNFYKIDVSKFNELGKIIKILRLEPTKSLPPPSGVTKMYQGGLADISVVSVSDERVDFKTSVDEISGPTSALGKIIKSVVVKLRGIPESPICDNQIFFGIGRE